MPGLTHSLDVEEIFPVKTPVKSSKIFNFPRDRGGPFNITKYTYYAPSGGSGKLFLNDTMCFLLTPVFLLTHKNLVISKMVNFWKTLHVFIYDVFFLFCFFMLDIVESKCDCFPYYQGLPVCPLSRYVQ